MQNDLSLTILSNSKSCSDEPFSLNINSNCVNSELQNSVDQCSENFDMENTVAQSSTLNSESLLDNHMDDPTSSNISLTDDSYKLETSKIFIRICDTLNKNPEAIAMSGKWVPQVITNMLPCIMWTEYEQGYTEILKRVVLFPDLKLDVSI